MERIYKISFNKIKMSIFFLSHNSFTQGEELKYFIKLPYLSILFLRFPISCLPSHFVPFLPSLFLLFLPILFLEGVLRSKKPTNIFDFPLGLLKSPWNLKNFATGTLTQHHYPSPLQL